MVSIPDTCANGDPLESSIRLDGSEHAFPAAEIVAPNDYFLDCDSSLNPEFHDDDFFAGIDTTTQNAERMTYQYKESHLVDFSIPSSACMVENVNIQSHCSSDGEPRFHRSMMAIDNNEPLIDTVDLESVNSHSTLSDLEPLRFIGNTPLSALESLRGALPSILEVGKFRN